MELGYSPLFLLGLVAGFNFIKEWEVTRYQLAREDGHKLYFRAAFWGLAVSISTAALILTFAYLGTSIYHNQLSHPFDAPTELVLLTLIVSPITAYAFAKVLNRFVNKLEHYYDALKENEFEYMLVTAMTTEFMVMITMEDSKIYVGWVYQVSDPAKAERKYFSIIPVMTGFRNERREVEFTTYYNELYQLTNDALAHLDINHFAVVLPVHRLVSCRLFDADAYSRFEKMGLVESPQPANV
jgi:hypothetical protein